MRVRIAGQRRVYTLDPAPLTEVADWVGRHHRLWTAALDRPGEHLTPGGDPP